MQGTAEIKTPDGTFTSLQTVNSTFTISDYNQMFLNAKTTDCAEKTESSMVDNMPL